MTKVKTVTIQRKRRGCHLDGVHGEGGTSRMLVIFLDLSGDYLSVDIIIIL